MFLFLQTVYLNLRFFYESELRISCKSFIAILAWRVTENDAYSPPRTRAVWWDIDVSYQEESLVNDLFYTHYAKT